MKNMPFLLLGVEKSMKMGQGRYGRMSPTKNYLYLRISQKEPFDILCFTPSLTWIFNIDDQSFSLSPELVYPGITNLELRLKAAVLASVHFTACGEKQNNYRIELRVRYFFLWGRTVLTADSGPQKLLLH
jgi:hypothetical protein